MSRKCGKTVSWPLLLGAVFLSVTIGYPVLVLLIQSVFPEFMGGSVEGAFSAYHSIFETPGLGEMLWNSLMWGTCTVLGAWLLGVPCGWLLARTNLPGKKWARILLLVPIMSPAYINALAYILVMQPGGFADLLTGGLTEEFRGFFFGFWGVTFVMVMASFGGVALAVEAVLRNIPSRLEDAAVSLGAKRWQVLAWVTLPLLLPALLNSGILVFLDAVSNFGVPAIMGPRANLPLLPAEIYYLVTSWPIDLPLATALSALLCLVAVALLSVGRHLLGRFPLGRTRSTLVKETSLGLVGKSLGWGWLLLLFVLSALLPNAAVVATSFIDTWGGGDLQWTDRHYNRVFDKDSGAFEALTTSLGLSLLTATVCVLVGGIVAYGIARSKGPLASGVDSMSLMPRVIPRIVTAVAFIMAWNAPWVLIEVYNTIWILVLAYFALYQSDALRFGDAGMRNIGVNLEQAAESLGASRWQVLRSVVLPLLAPLLFVAWVTTFVVCMRDWVASIILLPPGVQTIGSFIFNQFDQGEISAAMAMA
ncbi:MAG: ABC transporter permease, partial [Verrucomicrobiales bacterium]